MGRNYFANYFDFKNNFFPYKLHSEGGYLIKWAWKIVHRGFLIPNYFIFLGGKLTKYPFG